MTFSRRAGIGRDLAALKLRVHQTLDFRVEIGVSLLEYLKAALRLEPITVCLSQQPDYAGTPLLVRHWRRRWLRYHSSVR